MALATPEELASYMQQDLDLSTAVLVLDIASDRFQTEADTVFTVTAVTYETKGRGQSVIAIPYHPLVAVIAVRVEGVVVDPTEYDPVGQELYRSAGWGGRLWRPSKVEVDLTYGYDSAGDDVKGAVLEAAAGGYSAPNPALSMEQIDDYTVRYAALAVGTQLSPAGIRLAERYRFGGFA